MKKAMNMKGLALTMVLIASMTAANAQTWHFGPKAGYSASWMPGTVIDGGEKIIPHSSFYAGMLLDYDFEGMFYMEAELLYAGKGYSDRGGIDVPFSRQLNYLQIPVMAGVELIEEKAYVTVGPEFGWLMSSTTKKQGFDRVNDTKSCNRFNIALGVQLEYMIVDELGVDLKFDWGLNRTKKYYQPYEILDPVVDKGHNMSIQVGLCYKFEL